MRSALRNFLAVTWVLAMCAFIAWSYFRHQGLSAPLKTPLAHPFLTSKNDIVAYPPPPSSTTAMNFFERLDAIAAMSKDIVLWIDIHPLLNGTLVVGTPTIVNISDADSNKIPTLDQVLARYTSNRLILNFHANRPGMIEEVIKSVEKANASDRLLIQSPEDGFLRDLREAKPLWLYGTSQARVTQMLMLASIGLEATAPIKGDVFVMETEPRALWRISDDIISEVHRRKMKIYAGPAGAQEAIQLRNRGVDGVLTSQPAELLGQAHR